MQCRIQSIMFYVKHKCLVNRVYPKTHWSDRLKLEVRNSLAFYTDAIFEKREEKAEKMMASYLT